MKLKFLLPILFCITLQNCKRPSCPEPGTTEASEKTAVFKLTAVNGKDASIATNSLGGNTSNYAGLKYLVAQSWTSGGFPQNQYILIDFDLSSIPADAVISSAQLNMFADTTRDINSIGAPGHSTISGPNDAYLMSVTSAWTENTVTWNTQPTVDNVNSMVIPATFSPNQKYQLNVTDLVKKEVASASNYHGFMIQMANPANYRQVVFYSSECEFPLLTPELKIKYVEKE